MEELNKYRGHCEGSDFYLERKSNNVGAYCSKCNKWIAWCGKSTLNKLQELGYEIAENSKEIDVDKYKDHCKGSDIEIKQKGPHKGIYCTKCGKWLRWCNNTDIIALKKQGYYLKE